MIDTTVFAVPGLWIQQCEAQEGGPKWYAYHQGVGVHFESTGALLEAYDRDDLRSWLREINRPELVASNAGGG